MKNYTNMIPKSEATDYIVIDATLGVWAVVVDEAQADVVNLFTQWHEQNNRIVVPELWLAEATTVIRRLVFHKSITTAEGEIALQDLFVLSIEIVHPDIDIYQQALKWSQRLQQAKAYDSLYVALAENLNAEFWMADKRLFNGLRQIGVSWVHLV